MKLVLIGLLLSSAAFAVTPKDVPQTQQAQEQAEAKTVARKEDPNFRTCEAIAKSLKGTVVSYKEGEGPTQISCVVKDRKGAESMYSASDLQGIERYLKALAPAKMKSSDSMFQPKPIAEGI